MNNEKLKIAYERLSRDDEQQGESNSITNQKMLLDDYAARHGYTGLTHLTDDGYSGTNWNRPAIVKLIDEVERGNVELVLVKDMSRLGRDHLRVGLLLEQFRERGVRFIAINDNVDTDREMDEFLPFRNIINEWVARDTSRKIRAINDARTKDGKRVTGAIPYGYIHDPQDRQKWILDEDAAPIVCRMFRSVIEGKTVSQIARELTTENILIPSAHWAKIGAGMRKCPKANPTKWSEATVINIFKKEEYMGWKVLNKTTKESYKTKKRDPNPEGKLIFKDAHPAIVDEETWNVVQRLRETRRRPERIGGEPNPLTGVLFCADCGHKMYHKQGRTDRPDHPHHEYVCSSYRHYTRSCTCHYIRVSVIENLILTSIRRVSKYVRENETEFIERVRETSALQQETAIKENRKKLLQAERRREEITGLIKKLYETFATGKIPENHFADLLKDYDTEQTALNGEIAELQAAIDKFNTDSVRADKFIELVKRHTEFTEFSPLLLNEFIEKIIVHEGDKSSGKRVQEVEIFLNFIGKFNLPELESEQAQEQQTPKRPRTDADREHDRRRYAKKRNARIAAEQAERAAILEGTKFAV